ncbi:MAG: HlyD family type I secretion periplasmic adaptor subunit [Hyphomonadaceae bacterium]|nr:HlyD family type I secretion periplasmic adaptor subunit [Hyphomonadaceae bacterium]
MNNTRADNANVSSAWLNRLRRPERENNEASIDPSFLPAALEVLERPPSPVGRLVIWVIMAAAVFALVWVSLAQIDIVAVAEGRIIPRARLQSVEAAEGGIIRAVLVSEGQRVRAGDALIELDPTMADAEAQSAAVEYATARLAKVRAEALLAYVDGQTFTPQWPEDIDPAAAAAEAQVVRARIASLREHLSGIDTRIVGAQAARDSARADRLGMEETLPLVEQQLAARRTLAERGFAAPALVAQWEERAVTQRRALEARRADERQAEAEVSMLRRERAQTIEEFRAQAAGEKAEAEAITATRAQSVRRAQMREGLQVLTAPVDGVVNEVAVSTLGDVVQAGAPLVTIVPAGSELIVEALILNRDVGFVLRGQEVVVKLEAFPFTRHGFLEGEVEHVSADAITDDVRGLVYPARIRIVRSRLRGIEGRARSTRDLDALAPGMSAQVEVITGRRTVLSFLLSPISRATQEAARER